MSYKERLSEVDGLKVSIRMQYTGEAQLEKYIKELEDFIASFPESADELKEALERKDNAAVSKNFGYISDALRDIHADDLAEKCHEQMNIYRSSNLEKVAAQVYSLISDIMVLSIDIQMVIFQEERKSDDEAAAQEGEKGEKSEKSEYEKNRMKTMLVVDDDTFFLDTFKEAMKNVPFKITGVTTGSEALEILENQKIDLYVLDIDMPEMDGIKLAEEIKKRRKKSNIIFFSGNATREYLFKAMEAGASDFIVKPINAKAVVSKICKYL